MIRVIALTAVAVIALAAFVYGVVLNGFGLFDDSSRPKVAESAPDSAVAPETEAVDPGVAGRGNARLPSGSSDQSPPGGQYRQQPTDPSGTPAADGAGSRVARNVTPPNVLARPTSRYIDPAAVQERKDEEEEEKSDIRRYHQIIVRDAATLESGDTTIRLSGISPVAADKTCTDEAGQTWPCGRVAAAALRMLIRRRAVDCTIVTESADEIVGNCSAGLQDINGWLVEQGWAEADPGAGYAAEADAARAEKRGIYLAKWEATGTGGTGLQPPTPFTAPAIPSQSFSTSPPQTAEPGPSAESPVQAPVN